jgi:predicted Zn-dependent peptidase
MNIHYNSFVLSNGLKVLVHERTDTQLVAVNVLYHVGARNESPNRTGFAHLFEHLMFGGSVNIPEYDKPLQDAGGDNNAFTSNDITNYYLTLPAENIETAFWLESDRMLSLAFTPKSLEVQRKVVMEEFRQRYLNQPYGDAMLYLRPLIYKKHPYKWSTIGKKLSHISGASLDDVKAFFYKHYAPNNAILTVAGNIKTAQVKKLSEKWFGPIPSREIERNPLPVESPQRAYRSLQIVRNVPADAIYMAFKMPARLDPMYAACDLLSDILGNGRSSRLYAALVDKKKVFSDIRAYIAGSLDPGFLVIEGKLLPGIKIEKAEAAIRKVLDLFIEKKVTEQELEKVKNKSESTFLFSNMGVSNIAMNLGYYELLGDASMINNESLMYREVTVQDIQKMAVLILARNKACVLHYLKSARNES